MQTGRMVMEYCLNAVWLVPAVAAAAWLFVRVSGLRPAAEHRVWLAALAVCLALPALGISARHIVASAPVAAVSSSSAPAGFSRGLLPLTPEPEQHLLPPAPDPVASSPHQPASPRWRPHPRTITIPPKVAARFIWLYAGVVGLAAFRLLRNWWAAVQLIRDASPYAGSEAEHVLWRELAARFRVPLPPVYLSHRVQSPVIVGIWRPALLLPADFSRCPEPERRAALAHELAHVSRRDCVVHAAVQTLLLPIVWHPAVHFVTRKIARTREMVCDDMAARAMTSGPAELTYARCLLNLAQRMAGAHTAQIAGIGLGLFRTNQLEERVMRLTESKRTENVLQTWMRRVGGAAVAAAFLVAGAMLHVAPVVAQQAAPLNLAAPQATTAPEPPRAPQAAMAPPAVIAPPTSLPAPAPRPAPAPPESFAPASSLGGGSSFGFASSGSQSLSEDTPAEVFEDDHGEHLIVKDGTHVHRWVGADGQRYEVRDSQSAPYTSQQERAAEAESKRRIAQAQLQLDKIQKKLNSPEFQHQIDQLSSQATQQAMARAQADLAKATAQFNSPEFQAQMAQLNSPTFKPWTDAQRRALQAQAARFNSPEFAAEIAKAAQQAVLIDTPAMQQKFEDAARRMDEAAARLDAAAKALAEAQKRLKATPAK